MGVMLGIIVFRRDQVFPRPQPIVPRVDIYSDRITYRTRSYETATGLAIGLKAANEPPSLIELHDCNQFELFEDTIDVVRADGDYQFELVMPEGGC